MSDDVLRDLQYLHDLRSQGLSDEETARALLDLTLQAAPPDLANAVRVCAIPAWFDTGLLAFLADQDEEEAAALLEQVAAFSFVLPREGGGYVYHEATRARLLDWWREPDHLPRFAELNERLARHYLALAREQRPRLSGPDYLDALTAMDAAYPNVRAAWEGAVETENYEIVRGFAYALAGYQGRRGLWEEKLSSAREGLTACERLDDRTGRADMQNNLGNAYAQLPTGDRAANLAQAIECYREALRIEHLPSWSQIRYLRNLGDAYGELEDYASAIGAYRQAIDLNPDDPWLFNALGNAYSRQDQHEQAIETYTAALVLTTDDGDKALLHRNRASDLIYLDRLDEAEQDCEQARSLAPDHPYTHARLGQIAFAHDDYPAAVEHYTAAIDLQPEAGFHFDRGLTHLALGHQDQALADYQAAIPLADSLALAEALKELNDFAADHPDTPGLGALRTILSSPS